MNIQVSEKQLECLFKELTTSAIFSKAGYSFYVLGLGGLSKTEVKIFKLDERLSVLWSGTSLPWFMWPLRFIPNQAVLVKIYNPTELFTYVFDVGNGSMVKVMWLNDTHVDSILKDPKNTGTVYSVEKSILPESEFLEIETELDPDDRTGTYHIEYRCSREYEKQIFEVLRKVSIIN